ncbi:hypothetical protein B0H10DRAFT_2225031 [Mycena sp. CBHHK59/15]|nr:hypothetical protein B0H10DRAFT_2225031 [Mycena sp. CBHHK59/15]
MRMAELKELDAHIEATREWDTNIASTRAYIKKVFDVARELDLQWLSLGDDKPLGDQLVSALRTLHMPYPATPPRVRTPPVTHRLPMLPPLSLSKKAARKRKHVDLQVDEQWVEGPDKATCTALTDFFSTRKRAAGLLESAANQPIGARLDVAWIEDQAATLHPQLPIDFRGPWHGLANGARERGEYQQFREGGVGWNIAEMFRIFPEPLFLLPSRMETPAPFHASAAAMPVPSVCDPTPALGGSLPAFFGPSREPSRAPTVDKTTSLVAGMRVLQICEHVLAESFGEPALLRTPALPTLWW